MKTAEDRRRISFALLLAACLVVPLKEEYADSASRLSMRSEVVSSTTVSYAAGYGVLVYPRPDSLIDLERWLVQIVAVWLACLWLNGASPWPKSFDRNPEKTQR